MKKIKVLQMPVRNAKGGITQYALENWVHIDKARFIFDWVTLDNYLSFASELESQGCRVHYLSGRQEEDEARFRAEMMAIFSQGYDAIHLHTSYWRGFLAEELAIEAGIKKIIVHAHSTGIDVIDAAERARLLAVHEDWKRRFTPELATDFVACSGLAADFLYGPQIPKERILVLKNAIDTEKFAFNENVRNEMRKEMGLDGKFVILQTARLVHQKNHAFSLDLFARVVKDVPNAVLLLAGEGTLKESLERQAAELGITQCVHFLGFRDDVNRLLQAGDVLIAPSLFEGFSISTIEAQCSGIRCFCCFCCIPDEAVVLENTRRLPLEMEQWHEEIIGIAKNPPKRRDRSAEIAAAGYTLNEQINVLKYIYNK